MSNSNSVADLKRLGQSIWLDPLDRRMIASGELKRFRDAGVSGVTANPTIFAKALEASEVYAGEVKQRLGVVPKEVVDTPDRRVTSQGGMGSDEVVAVQPCV